MRKTNRNTLLAALLGGLALTLAPAQGARAQAVPPGSYQKTCPDPEVKGTTLKVWCKAVEGSEGHWNHMENFHECVSEIVNSDGKLYCQRSPNNARIRQAVRAIDSTLPMTLGKRAAGAADYYLWLGRMFDAGLLPQFYAGLTEKHAGDYFRAELAKPANGPLRAEVIEAAFKDVYGFGASPKDLASWTAGLRKGAVGYAHVVYNERHKLFGDQVMRRMVISNVYKRAMGRMPTASDYNYWMPRYDTYKEILDANRKWLHSTRGASDLAETVSRALEGKIGQKPTTQQVKDAVIKYAQAKAIFDEM